MEMIIKTVKNMNIYEGGSYCVFTSTISSHTFWSSGVDVTSKRIVKKRNVRRQHSLKGFLSDHYLMGLGLN